jgi:hypothetical protein
MAALNFPSSPTIGQQYAGTNGVTYTWDGETWTASGVTSAQARVKRATAQNVAQDTEVAMIFDTIITNVGGLYSAGTPDRFTIQQAGFYLIGGHLASDAGVTAAYRTVHIAINAVGNYTSYAEAEVAGNFTFNISTAIQLAAGAVVYLVVYQSVSAPLASGDNSFWIVRVG